MIFASSKSVSRYRDPVGTHCLRPRIPSREEPSVLVQLEHKTRTAAETLRLLRVFPGESG